MQYLDQSKLEAFDVEAFRGLSPYPWANPQALLNDDAFKTLKDCLPDKSLFKAEFGVKRSYGQAPHDRLSLEFDSALNIAPAWQEFVAELRGPAYGRFLRRAFGRGSLALTFHWHYTPRSCAVSPHCDAMRKLGSHIFYFNTEDDWEPAWGGQTLVLDDQGRFDRKSAPSFEELDEMGRSEILGNRSFLFCRTKNSWHGVREITCPENTYRKVFIVVVEDKMRSLVHTVLDRVQGKKRSRY